MPDDCAFMVTTTFLSAASPQWQLCSHEDKNTLPRGTFLVDHSYFSWAFVPRFVKELDALTISPTVWFCRIKQSQAPHDKHLSARERPLLVACSHPKQSSISGCKPACGSHPSHVPQSPRVPRPAQRDCYLGMFFSGCCIPKPNGCYLVSGLHV